MGRRQTRGRDGALDCMQASGPDEPGWSRTGLRPAAARPREARSLSNPDRPAIVSARDEGGGGVDALFGWRSGTERVSPFLGLAFDRVSEAILSNGARMSKDFDLLASIASFAHDRGIGLNDPKLIATYTAETTPKLEAALADQALIQGSRTEKLFEAMVLSLGKFRLLKTEDTGRVHSAEKLRAPDFRVVLDDGEQWLIEVKNVRCKDPAKQRTTLTVNYLNTLRAYSDMVGLPLRLAIYWSTWKLWTLIDPATFARSDGGLKIEMTDAITANHMGRLGDVSIHTTSPLRFTVPKRPDGKVDTPEAGIMGLLAGSRVFSGHVELVEPRERHLARILFAHGEWPLHGPNDVTD